MQRFYSVEYMGKTYNVLAITKSHAIWIAKKLHEQDAEEGYTGGAANVI